MNLSAQEACRNLVDALAEARAVNAEQKQRVEAARQKAESTQEGFLSFLKAQQSDVASAEAQQQRRQQMEQVRSRLSSQGFQEDIVESSALNLRWVQAFCDSQIALMRLYAYPEAQASAEQIAAQIRALRLLEVERPLPATLPEPKLPDANAEDLSEEERQREKIGMALNFMQGMDGYRERVKQSYQERSDQTQTLLKQMYEEAEALAQRLKA